MLDHLCIQGNQLSSLAGLHACARLRHLDAGFNCLTAFPAKEIPLQHLSHLSLDGNRCGLKNPDSLNLENSVFGLERSCDGTCMHAHANC